MATRAVLGLWSLLLVSGGCGSQAATPADAPPAAPDAPVPMADAPADAPADASPDAPSDLPGVPRILQVMVSVASSPARCVTRDAGGACVDALRDPLSPFELTYGAQASYALCGLDQGGQPVPEECPRTVSGLPLTCARTGDLAGHCVDPTTLGPPIVRTAISNGIVIRLVVGELLDGKTLEAFACACQGRLLDLDESRCPAGRAWTGDPFDCSPCGGDATTAGRCLDEDNNGVPDVAALLPGVATIRCGAAFTHVSARGEGYFYPSGNQLQSSVSGLEGMGPALVLAPKPALPTESDCTVSVAPTVKTRDGQALEVPAPPPVFHTDGLGLDRTSAAFQPADGATDVPVSTRSLVLVLSSPLDPASVVDGNFVVENAAGAALPGTTAALTGAVQVTVSLPAGPDLAGASRTPSG